MLPSPPAQSVALGPSAEPPRTLHAAAAGSSPPPPRPKRRFDIESLLAKPEPPRRRSALLPPSSYWPLPAAQRFGCAAGGLLPFACLPERPPPGCPRPVPGLVFSPCAAPPSLGAALSWPSGGGCRMKRVRTVFTPEQLERLEKEFHKQQYMVGTERVDLAATLHLTETQVKVWFQNRRIKWRKQSLEQKVAKFSQFGTTEPEPPGQPGSQDRPEGDI